jgi:hypothetical protein
LLDIGVKRVRECVSKPDLNSTEENIENNFSQNEDNESCKVLNPRFAKTKGRSSVRHKGHFEKRKRSTTKEKKIKVKD